MSFSLRLLDEPIPADWLLDGEQGFLINVIIGDFEERDAVLTGFWSKQDYLQQWAEACQKIVNGPTKVKAGFATAVHNPKSPGHGYVIQWWAAYKEGRDVFIQSVPTVYDARQAPVVLSRLYEYVPDREVDTGVSEWKVTVEDIRQFGEEIANVKKVDEREAEFLSRIDCDFPYKDLERCKSLIDEAASISTNATFGTLEELARPPVNIPREPIRRNVETLIDYLGARCDHPLKDKALFQARLLFNNQDISVEDAIRGMNEAAEYPGQYGLLNLYYFGCDDIEDLADKEYQRITTQWTEK